jgi:hypothetical protein
MLHLLQQYHHYIPRCTRTPKTFEVHCSSEPELKFNTSILYILVLEEIVANEQAANLLDF